METKLIIITIVIFALLFIVLSFYIGYIIGLKQMKRIDDKIINEISEKNKEKINKDLYHI